MFKKPERSWLEEELEFERRQARREKPLWDRLMGFLESRRPGLFWKRKFDPVALSAGTHLVTPPNEENMREMERLVMTLSDGWLTIDEFRGEISNFTDAIRVGNTWYTAIDRQKCIEEELKGPYGIHWV